MVSGWLSALPHRWQKGFQIINHALILLEARYLVAIVGIIVALAGVITAMTIDKIIGIAVVLVGGFLITLPFTRPSD